MKTRSNKTSVTFTNPIRSFKVRPLIESLEQRALLSVTLTTLANFNLDNGKSPVGLVADATGNLYGTTRSGGANGDGTVFELSGQDHKTLTTLLTFDGTNGSGPYSGLAIDTAGNLFGTTRYSNSTSDGTVFELSGAGHQTFTTLKAFSGELGGPTGVLTFDPAGNLYGTDLSGTANNSATRGSVFELSGAAHQTFTTQVSFSPVVGNVPYPNGGTPYGGLVSDSAGNLYGVGSNGGPSDLGTVFRLSGADHQTVTPLVSFTGANGANPEASLSFDTAGNLYGTTLNGGTSNHGTVFELMAPTFSTVTTLLNFDGGNGSAPYATPVFDSAGNLYGTTQDGGSGGQGTVFELSGIGHQTVTTLVNFDGANSGGQNPIAGLLIDSAGNIFGTTDLGGTGNRYGGTVFELTGVNAAASNALVVTSIPATNIAGQLIAPAVTVSEEDSNTNIVTTGNASVTLAINTGTAGAALGGTLTEPLVNGVATFSNLTINAAGTYTLVATDATDTQGLSSAINVTAAIPSVLHPTILKSTLPVSLVAGQPVRGAFSISVINTSGTLLTGATIGIYASTSNSVDGNSISIGSLLSNHKFAAGKTAKVSVMIKSLPQGLNGSYTLFARVTDSSGKSVASSTGTPLTVSVPVIAFSETILKTSLTAKAFSGAKTRATVSFKVTNNGNILSKGASHVSLYLSLDGTVATGTLIRTASVSIVLKPGAHKVVAVTLLNLPQVAAGNYYLVALFTDPAANTSDVRTVNQFALAAVAVGK